MSSNNVIRVSEFEKLYYNEDKPFKQKHWEALCKYLENINKKEEKRIEYFRILNKGIQFTNFVGVIQAGNLTIEVLPKINKGSSTASNETVENSKDTSPGSFELKSNWHNVLLNMLKECRFLKVNHVDYANLNLRSNSILEVYLELFLNETERLLHEGLVKKYKKNDGNQNALKGQLIFSKQIAYNITHQERFFVRYTEYSNDNIYNQIIYKTILLIPTLSNSIYLLDKVGRLLLDFPEVSDITVTNETFNRLPLNRKTERYAEALMISKMLLLNYRPDITGGNENVIAILFDMNKLWEEFVYRRLKREEIKFGITVHRQQSAEFWKSSSDAWPKKIRPDIVMKKDKSTIIIDTKWKTLDDLIPADDDLKQMFVYNLFWECEKSILLYPSLKGLSGCGDYYDFRKIADHYTQCAIETVNVLDDKNHLDKAFGAKVLGNIIEKKI